MPTYSSLNIIIKKKKGSENYGFDCQCFLVCFLLKYEKLLDQGYGRQEIVNLDKCPSQAY